MKILLDETYGLDPYTINKLNVELKAAKLSKKSRKVQKENNGLMELPLKKIISIPYSLQEEIDYFLSIQDDIILYFYDASYSSSRRLAKLRNWLLPEKRLFPVRLPINRAQFFLEVRHLADLLIRSDHLITYGNLSVELNSLRQNSNGRLIVPKLNPFTSEDNVIKHYKVKEQKPYKLFETPLAKKNKPIKMGSVSELWKDLMEAGFGKGSLEVVQKEIQLDLPEADKIHKVEGKALPFNVPFLHIVQIPYSS